MGNITLIQDNDSKENLNLTMVYLDGEFLSKLSKDGDLKFKVKAGKKQPKKCPFKCIKTCDISKSPYCIIVALINALKGNFENGYAFAGVNAFRATKISSVKEIFQSLIKEYAESK